MVSLCPAPTVTFFTTAPEPSSGKYVTLVAAAAACGLERVRKVRKSKRPVPSAKYQTLLKRGQAPTAWPSLMRGRVGSKEWKKYITRSTVMADGALIEAPTPRLTGSDTLRPMPPCAVASNTGMVSRLLASTLTVFWIGPEPSRL